jgi:hypothetical protein
MQQEFRLGNLLLFLQRRRLWQPEDINKDGKVDEDSFVAYELNC